MPLVRKLREDWMPVEALDKTKYPDGFNVGDTIVISDPKVLLKNKTVILVDEKTFKDIPYSNILECQYCNFVTEYLAEFTAHLQTHLVQQATPKLTTIKPTESEPAKVYKCKNCDFTTEKVIQLAQHARTDCPARKQPTSKSK